MAYQTTADKVLQALQAHNLKKDGAEYRCNNPFIANSDSQAFKLKIEHGESGTYCDHAHREYKGTLYELAAALGIETPEGGVIPVDTTKREYRGLDDYAAVHGTTGDVFRAAGWVETVYQDRPALEYPTDNGKRYRFLDMGKEKYKSVFGYKPCWYGLKRAAAFAAKEHKPLILCNGEATSIVANAYGLRAFSMTAGEKALPANLLETLIETLNKGGFSDFWIALDCDKTGRDAAREIAAQLVEKGQRARIVDLGLGNGGDLADFCKLFEERAESELTARATAEKITVTKPEITQGELTELHQAIKALEVSNSKPGEYTLEIELTKAQAAVDRVRSKHAKPRVYSTRDLTKQNLENIRERRANPDRKHGLMMGLRAVDNMVGELIPEIYTLYGATSMGKSTCCVSVARSLAVQAPGLIVTTESHPTRWYNKLIASFTRIPSNKIESGQLTDDEFFRVESYMEMLSDFDVHFLDSGNPTVLDVRAEVLRLQPKWLIVDSMSKMDAPGATSIYDITRNVSNGLQALMQDVQIPVIKTVQIARDVENRPVGQKQPRLGDAYGGGIIEHNSGVIIGVYNHQYYVDMQLEPATYDRYPMGTTSLTLMKHRWNDGARVSRGIVQNISGVGYFDTQTQTVNISNIAAKGAR